MNELILTEQETKFLGHILNDAWYQIDSDRILLKKVINFINQN